MVAVEARHIRRGFATGLATTPPPLAIAKNQVFRHNGGDLSDVDDFDDLEMIMQQVQSEQHQEKEAERVRHRNYIYRKRLDAEARLMADYFGPHPKYPEYYFRKRYRMSQSDPMKQESARKDVERAFGVLQGRWHIICQPARAWTVNKLRRIMYTCIILHNMILKDQKFALSEFDQQNYICPQANILRTWVERCELQRRKSKELRDKQTHAKLQRNVIEHLWQQHQHED
ncbi:ALP1-like protein isoform X1 [Tanacetum coccineum]